MKTAKLKKHKYFKYADVTNEIPINDLLFNINIFNTNIINRDINIQARFACLRCAAGGHKVSTGGSLRSPGVTLFNYEGDNISTYVYLSVIKSILLEKSQNLSI